MARLLKQSTAEVLRIGPFLDDSDGKTAETGLTIAQADIQISKNGGAFAQTSDASPTTTHDADGWYQLPLTTTDTGTLGPLTVQIAVAGALPVWEHFLVVPAHVYDTFHSTDYFQVDVIQVEGADATDQIRDSVVDDATLIDASALNTLSGYAPASTIAAQSDVTGLNDPTAAAIADAVWDEAAADHVGAGSFGQQCGTDIDAILADTNELQGDWADAGRLDALIDAIKAKTDNLPADPADDSDIDSQLSTITTHLTDLKGTGFVKDTDSMVDLTHIAGTKGSDNIHDDIAALNDISAADVWDSTEAVTGDTHSFETIMARLYMFFFHEMNITDATGAVQVRDSGDTGNVLTHTITDDDTTTDRTKTSFV